MRLQRRHTPVAPKAPARNLVRLRDASPSGQDASHVLRLEYRGRRRIGRDPLPGVTITQAVVRDPARRVELDGLERTHERPAQAEAFLDGRVEVLRADHALA